MKPFVGLLTLLGAATAVGQLTYGLPASVSNVQYRTLASGNDLRTTTPGVQVFNEPIGWANYWRQNHRGPAPTLERGFFNNWRIVAIHAASRPTGGYSLGVQKIVRRIDKATIFTLESTPPPRGMTTQQITSPWVLLRVERGAFDFVIQNQRVQGYAGSQSYGNGTTVKVGGATVTFGPGYGGGGCDHCHHRGRRGCDCERGARGCDCRDD